MFDPQAPGFEFVLAAGKARQSAMLQEAEGDRLKRRLRVGPSLLDRALAGLGNWLIAAGAKLQGQSFYQDNLQVARRQ